MESKLFELGTISYFDQENLTVMDLEADINELYSEIFQGAHSFFEGYRFLSIQNLSEDFNEKNKVSNYNLSEDMQFDLFEEESSSQLLCSSIKSLNNNFDNQVINEPNNIVFRQNGGNVKTDISEKLSISINNNSKDSHLSL